MRLLRSFAFFGLTAACAANEPRGQRQMVEPAPMRPTTRPANPVAPREAADVSETALVQASTGGGALRALDVPGFEPALLFTPPGDAQRPLVIAAHGAGGGPEWECAYWRRLTRERAFVLCLSGTRLGKGYEGYFFRDHRALDRELRAAEAAARRGEPRMVAGSGIYAGFSQGATMGTAIVAQHAEAFPYAVLIEGFTSWNVPGARQFMRAGGRRVLLACGSKECASVAKASQHWFEVAGGEARVEHAAGAGHTPAGPVMDKIEAALPWLVQGDANWQ